MDDADFHPEVKTYQVSILERSAILALCKIMCISNKLCKEHIQLLFDLL